MELNVKLPEDLAKKAGLTGVDAPEQATFLLLLELYREGRVSLGRLADLTGLPQAELLKRIGDHNTYLNYSSADLADDRKALL